MGRDLGYVTTWISVICVPDIRKCIVTQNGGRPAGSQIAYFTFFKNTALDRLVRLNVILFSGKITSLQQDEL